MVVIDNQVEHNRYQMAQRSEQIELLLHQVQKARYSEEGLRQEENDLCREEMACTAAFNNIFLGFLGQLVQTITKSKVLFAFSFLH